MSATERTRALRRYTLGKYSAQLRGADHFGKGNIMEDSKNRGPFSRTHINVNEGFELRYWAKQLGVSLQQLKAAVRKVGSETDLVRSELKRQGF